MTFFDGHDELYQQCLNCEKKEVAERWKRGAEGAEGRGMGNGVGVSPSPTNYGVWGSVVSSPSEVRGRAPTENEFGAFCGR